MHCKQVLHTAARVTLLAGCLSSPIAPAAPLGVTGGSMTLLAQAELSQLQHDMETLTFTSDQALWPGFPELDVRKPTFNADVEARAAPFRASTYVVKSNHGVNVSSTNAVFQGSAIQIDTGPAFQALLTPGVVFLDVLVNFEARVGPGGGLGVTLVPGLNGVSRQSTAQISATVSTDSLLGHQVRVGGFGVVNGSTFHSFTPTGFFAGLGEGDLTTLTAAGGTVTVAVPARVSSATLDSALIGLGGSVGFVTALASGSGSFVNGAAAVEFRSTEITGVTLLDGRPLTGLGVTYKVLPSLVPLPGSLPLLGVALVALRGRVARRRRAADPASAPSGNE